MVTKQKDIFVGRKEDVEKLDSFLLDHLSNLSQRVRIISVFGKSGVGKSYLVDHVLNRFRDQTTNDLILRIYYSKNTYSLASIFTGQLLNNARSNFIGFSNLQKSRKVIENIDEEFVSKSVRSKDRNSELKNRLFKEARVVGIKGFLEFIKTKSGMKSIDIPEEDIRDLLKNLPKDSHNALDRIFNTKKYRIDNNLEREVGTDLINDLKAMRKHNLFKRKYIRSLIFIIDDYEALQPFVESILLSNLIGPLKNQDFNSLFIFIGREELDWNTYWRVYEECRTPSIELKAFSDKEARGYLKQKGIKKLQDIKRIINKSHNLPLLLEILSDAVLNNTEAKWVEDYFERITAHMDDQQKEWLKKFSFLDTRVDQDTISVMVGNNKDEAKKAFEWFIKEGTAYINTSEGWEVDPIVRSLVREKVKQDSLLETQNLVKQAKLAKEIYDALKDDAN